MGLIKLANEENSKRKKLLGALSGAAILGSIVLYGHSKMSDKFRHLKLDELSKLPKLKLPRYKMKEETKEEILNAAKKYKL